MKDRYEYYIYSEVGTEKSFYAENDKEAEDIMHCDKKLPKDIQLDLCRREGDGSQAYVTTFMRFSKSAK